MIFVAKFNEVAAVDREKIIITQMSKRKFGYEKKVKKKVYLIL